MAKRKSKSDKITPQQWEEITMLVKPFGKLNMSEVGRRYGISSKAIAERLNISGNSVPIKTIAANLAEATRVMEELPPIPKYRCMTLADTMIATNRRLANAAALGADTAERMATAANRSAMKICEEKTLEENNMPIRAVATYTKLANDASVLPIAMLKAQDAPKEQIDIKTIILPDDPQEAARIYQQFMLKKQ